MTDRARQSRSPTGVAIATVVFAGLAGVVVPPSYPRPGLALSERALAASSMSVLVAAFLVALCALVASLVRLNRTGRLLALVSLVAINAAGYLSGRYGVDGVGVAGTLLVTVPVMAAVVWGGSRIEASGW
jgi:hypothetical protein